MAQIHRIQHFLPNGVVISIDPKEIEKQNKKVLRAQRRRNKGDKGAIIPDSKTRKTRAPIQKKNYGIQHLPNGIILRTGTELLQKQNSKVSKAKKRSNSDKGATFPDLKIRKTRMKETYDIQHLPNGITLKVCSEFIKKQNNEDANVQEHGFVAKGTQDLPNEVTDENIQNPNDKDKNEQENSNGVKVASILDRKFKSVTATTTDDLTLRDYFSNPFYDVGIPEAKRCEIIKYKPRRRKKKIKIKVDITKKEKDDCDTVQNVEEIDSAKKETEESELGKSKEKIEVKADSEKKDKDDSDTVQKVEKIDSAKQETEKTKLRRSKKKVKIKPDIEKKGKHDCDTVQNVKDIDSCKKETEESKSGRSKKKIKVKADIEKKDKDDCDTVQKVEKIDSCKKETKKSAIKKKAKEPGTKGRKTPVAKKKDLLKTKKPAVKRKVQKQTVDIKNDKAVLNVENDKEDAITKIDYVKKMREATRDVLMYSNATAIRGRDCLGYTCCFCTDRFEKPDELKQHNIEEHKNDLNTFFKNKHFMTFYVKMDITYLKCKLCERLIKNIRELVDHLNDDHGKEIIDDIKNQIFPFKFQTEELRCCECSYNFYTFKSLQDHMHSHYRNFICDTCGAGFITKYALNFHEATHGSGSFKCDHCPKILRTMQKKKLHEKFVHVSDLRLKCGHCDEKFYDVPSRDKHQALVHGIIKAEVRCLECDKVFANRSSMRKHARRNHLKERNYKCTECDMKFFGADELERHMPKHTGSRDFKCEFCKKGFGRQKTLTEHMRVHLDDRKIICEQCGQPFIQKTRWKSHMRIKHQQTV